MGKINVVRADGSTVSVDEEDYKKSRGVAGAGEAEPAFAGLERLDAARAAARRNNQTVGDAIGAGAASAADTMSAGLLGKAVGFVDKQAGENFARAQQDNPGASLAGTVVGTVVPWGLAGKASEAGKAATFALKTGEKAGALAKAGGRVVEGAILGAGSRVAGSNASGDPLSVEGLIEDATVGGILNAGFGALGDRLTGKVERAQAVITKAKALEADAATLTATADTLEKSTAYEGVKDAHRNANNAAKASNRAIKRDAAAYQSWVSVSQKPNKAIDGYEAAANEVRGRIAATNAKDLTAAGAIDIGRLPQLKEALAQLKEAKDAAITAARAGDFEGVHATLSRAESRVKGLAIDVDLPVLPKRVKLAGGADFGAGVPDAKAVRDGALPSGAADVTDEMVTTVNAEDIKQHGYETLAQVGKDKVKLDKARKAISEGQLEPIRVAVSPGGKYHVEDGAHRLAAAIEAGSPISVKWYKGQAALDSAGADFSAEVKAAANKAAGGGGEAGDFSAEVKAAVSGESGDFSSAVKQKAKAAASGEPGDFSSAVKQRAQRANGKFAPAQARIDYPTYAANDTGIVALHPETEHLPESLVDIGRLKDETIARISNGADEATKAEVAKLSNELGLTPGVGEQVSDPLTTLRNHLRDNYIGPMSRLEEAGASGGAKRAKSILDGPVNLARRAVQYSAARGADIGGWKGAILRTIAGGAAGYALDGVEGAVAGGSLVNGRLVVRTKVAAALAKYGMPVASALKQMGPVSASLYNRFPSGERDTETDERKLAQNRMHDIMTASISAPDAMFYGVRPLMGDPSDLALKLHQKVVNSLSYLAMVAPKDPGIDVSMSGSNWTPSAMQADTFAHQYEATTNPLGYIVRTMSGDGHPAGCSALWTNWPAIMQEVVQEAELRDWEKLSDQEARGFSMLFQNPASGLQHPDVVATLQGQFLPKPETAGPSAGGRPGFGRSPKAVGRPAAVQSSVAGSSVSGLVSQ